MALILKPLADAELVLGSAQELGNLVIGDGGSAPVLHSVASINKIWKYWENSTIPRRPRQGRSDLAPDVNCRLSSQHDAVRLEIAQLPFSRLPPPPYPALTCVPSPPFFS